MGEDKPILTLVDQRDWEKSLQYDFTEPQSGLWCHFLTDAENHFVTNSPFQLCY